MKVLKQLRNRQKRKIQQLLESQSQEKQSIDQLIQSRNSTSSTYERSQLQDQSLPTTKSDLRVSTKKGCLKQNSKFDKLMIESDLGDDNRGTYSSLRKYDQQNDGDYSKLVQDEKSTDGEMTSSSTPTNKEACSGQLPPLNFTVLPRKKFFDDSLQGIQDKHKQGLIFKDVECRHKLSTFAKKQKFQYQVHEYQSSDLNESSHTDTNSPQNYTTKSYGRILRNDLFNGSSKYYRANLEFTSYPITDRNKDALDQWSSDDEMFFRCEDIEQTSNEGFEQSSAKNSQINTKALPQILSEVVQNKKRTELKKRINFESSTKQLENLKKLQIKLKLKNESDPHLNCLKLMPIFLKSKSDESSSKMSQDMKQEIGVPAQKVKVVKFRSMGNAKKSY